MSLNVLILEDDVADAELMVDKLRQAGYDPAWQRVQTQAAYLAHLDPSLDLILADHNLPQFDALSALKLLKARNLDIPFIIVSGVIGEELAVSAIQLGASDYMIKDRLSRLGSAVATALQTKALRLQMEQAEQQMRASEANFRLLAEQAQDIIFRYNLLPKLHLSYISPAVTRITGYTPEEHYANPALVGKVVLPEHLPTWLENISLRQNEKETSTKDHQPMELRWQSKDGRMIWLEAQSSLVYDDDGLCIAIVGIARDITERKRLEEERHMLSRAVEQSPASIIMTDLGGNIEYVNPKFCEVTGYTVAEVLGKNPRLLKSGYTPDEEYARLWQTITSSGEWRGEFHNKTKSGELYWESAIISPIYNDEGVITHFLAVKEDITERKHREQVQEALLTSANILRAAALRADMLASILRQMALILNAPLTFMVSPEVAEEEPALEPATLPGNLTVEAVYTAGDEINVSDIIGLRLPAANNVSAEVYRSGLPLLHQGSLADPLLEHPALQGAGQYLACVPLLTPNETIGVFWVVRQIPFSASDMRVLLALADMTASGLQRVTLHERLARHAANLEQEVAARTRELREANERLLELDRLKSKFVSDVSHELRTPVTNIGLYLDLIGLKPEKREQYTTVVREQAQRLDTLVKEVLDLARLDNGQAVPLTPVNLTDLVTQVVNAHQAQAASHDLSLIFEAAADLPLIIGNADKLMQIVTNLVSNGVNYTRRGGVTVRTLSADVLHKIVLEVADTGMGIDAAELPHLFERFYRATQDNAAVVPGSGLGLSIVKELVELHQGTIEVKSQRGVGTTFTITLPVAEVVEVQDEKCADHRG